MIILRLCYKILHKVLKRIFKRNIREKLLPDSQSKSAIDIITTMVLSTGHQASLERMIGKFGSKIMDHKAKLSTHTKL